MNTLLTQSEIQDLINNYQSEKRKLQFQLARIDALLSKLEGQYQGLADQTISVNFDEEITLPASGSQTKERSLTAPQKATLPKHISIVDKINQQSKGYRLSPWDAALLEGIEQASQPLINNELLRLLEEKSEELGEELDEADLKGKLNRSLHKLANKRKAIIKLPYTGRGFMYALKDWVTSNNKLKAAYHRAD